MSLPEILRVEDVMARYGMKDPRTARRLMAEAGGFKVAGRLVVREDVLGAYEQRQAVPRSLSAVASMARSTPRRGTVPAASPASGPDWWRQDVA